MAFYRRKEKVVIMCKKITSLVVAAIILLCFGACQTKSADTVTPMAEASAAPDVTAEPEEQDILVVDNPEGYTSFVSKAGERIYIGMSIEDCREVLGIVIEDNWQTIIPLSTNGDKGETINLSAVDGEIRAIMISSRDWTMENGIGLEASMEDAERVLGEPQQEFQYTGGFGVFRIYALNDVSNVRFISDESGMLTGIGASAQVMTSTQLLGIKNLLGQGSGDANISVAGQEYLSVKHEGSGAFKVILNTAYEENGKLFEENFLLIDRLGNYEGRVFAPSNGTSCDVTADGEWSIWGYSYTMASRYTTETSFSGTGDFATLHLNPDVTDISGTWKVVCDGDGSFVLRLNSWLGGFREREPLVNVVGSYSGEIEIEDSMLEFTDGSGSSQMPVVFEIFTEGKWIVEKAG